MSDSPQIPFQEVIDALLDDEHAIKPALLYRLSDLDPAEEKTLKDHWAGLSEERRRALMEDLENFAEADVLLSFDSVARIGLTDQDPAVRVVAIRILWEDDSLSFAETLSNLLETDDEEEVRAGAASALGNFVFLGWLDEIPKKTLETIESLLLGVIRSTEAPLVRRRALEAMGFSSRPDMPGVIEDAFTSDEEDWIASSLFAMGRSADRRWAPDILKMLQDRRPAIRLEAIRAAGELEIQEARPELFDVLDDTDDEVRSAAIWSLSQIGGTDVEEVLSAMLEESTDEDEIELLETAIDNLAFFSGENNWDLFDFDEDDLTRGSHPINGEP